MKGYKELDIYNLAFKLAVKIYRLSLDLPHPDKFETGSQIRRSSQSVKDNIAEGYGRRRYKADFIKFLVASHSSCLEATSQAEFLAEVKNSEQWQIVAEELNSIGIKIYNFIEYVDKNWKTGRG
ncbi:four helix bundle protein [Tangfeifania diversioriginum]|uniref:Four helix bundle protein n=1 Tax=Tangfeifania diversioriginum TaxID=1168035 RepID=A0A1M6I4A0_9BACT|nr:four helix bundle protein [Tangfeifania diversioriginum]SHJ29286.1 four helix bundle protein [Tangfeifania diversioriginum]